MAKPLLQQMFNTVYINGVYATDDDKRKFIADYKAGKVIVRKVLYSSITNEAQIETF